MDEKKENNSTTKGTDLPIGRDTERVLKEWMVIEDNLPKSIRYTIAPIIIKTLAQMIADVYFANSAKEERKYHLTNYIARLQCVKGLTRALHEARAISHKKSDYLSTMYENIGKQAVKWKNYSRA